MDWYRITKEVHGPFHQKYSIILLLPYNYETETCAFYDISGSTTYNFNLPKLRDKFIHGSSNGWVCVDNAELNLTLINPLTADEIKLPRPTWAIDVLQGPVRHADFSHPSVRSTLMTKFVVLGSSLSSNNFVFAAIMSTYNQLVVCRLRDTDWTPITVNNPGPLHRENCEQLNDLQYFKGELYAIDCGQVLVRVEFVGFANYTARYIRGPNYQVGDHHFCPSRFNSSTALDQLRFYLVECSGKLLAVRRLGEHLPDLAGAKTLHFELFEFDEGNESWNMIHGLGEKSLFLGQSASLSVSASEIPGCKKNCIYFTEDFNCGCNWEGFHTDNGVFHCETGTLEIFNISHSQIPWLVPPVWCQLRV